MNLRLTNLLLALLALGLVLAWLFTSYRLVRRTPKPAPQTQHPPDAAREGAPPGIWRLGLQLTMDGLEMPAVQWTMFSEDPAELFRQEQKRVPFSDPATLWDLLFRRVTGDEVHLLASNPNFTAGVASNGPGGRKWIVTKTARAGETVYCWCVPFNAAPGEDANVRLTKENAWNVADLNKE